jgi:hypothetical protein
MFHHYFDIAALCPSVDGADIVFTRVDWVRPITELARINIDSHIRLHQYTKDYRY